MKKQALHNALQEQASNDLKISEKSYSSQVPSSPNSTIWGIKILEQWAFRRSSIFK
jgi:hypothetical protein